MDHIKKAARSTKKFVSDHRVGIAVTVTAVTCLALNRSVVKQHNDFLKEHDLYEKFYTFDEE